MPAVDINALVNAAKGASAPNPPGASPVKPAAAEGATAPDATAVEPLAEKPAKRWKTGENGLPVFAVALQDNPRLEVEAEDRLDAIERYNAACGILGTIHKHSVERV